MALDDSYTPMKFEFTAMPGLHIDSHTAESLLVDFFNCLITGEIINLIVEENRFAQQFLTSKSIQEKRRARNWSPTEATDMNKFL